MLGFTLWIAGTPAVTRNLAIGYVLPVPLHQPHRITARMTARRAAHCTSPPREPATTVLCGSPTTMFVTVSVEHFAAHGDMSGFREMLERFGQEGGR